MMRDRWFTTFAAVGLTVALGLCVISLSAPAAEGEPVQALYVAVAGDNAVALVDLAARTVEKFPIDGAREPHAVALSPDRKTLYVGNAADGKVVVVDAATKKTLRVLEGSRSICGMVWSPDGDSLYLTDMSDGKIHEFKVSSGEVIRTIPVAERLCGLDFARDRKRAFLGNMVTGGQVVVLDWETKKVIDKIAVGKMPHHVGLSPDGKILYASVGGDGVIAKIDLAAGKIVSKIETGGDPHAILISPDGRRGYVTVRGKPKPRESSVLVLDLETDKIIDQVPGVGSRVCDLIWAR
jgi:DNA-binding beta-propeller fold protein YncE